MADETDKTVKGVTGASGYIGSWLVKNLLERGYTVNATLRYPGDERKSLSLLDLAGAEDRLKLLQADLLKEGSFDSAVEGCEGVFHLAGPTGVQSSPEVFMEGENNLACVRIDIQDGVSQQPLEVKRKPKSWFDQLEDDPEFEEYKKRKTVAGVSIYRVPEFLTKANGEAYDPLVVFLGPFHHKKDKEMAIMDRYKLQAVEKTFQRIPSINTRK